MNKTKIIFITGASGVGKTTLVKELEKRYASEDLSIFYFDTIGVPSVEKMVEEFGSCEKWQEHATHLWVEKLSKLADKGAIILEGQFNPYFAIDACRKFGIKNYKFVVVHADRSVREKRLIKQRHQPELVNDNMNTWAEFLKREVLVCNGSVIDTSYSDLERVLSELIVCIN